MNILLNPEINTNTHTSARRIHKNNVSFKGPIGDQILKKGINNITLEEVMPKLKTFFGLFFSGAVIKDVMESFIKRLQELNKLEDMTKQLTDANNEKNNLRAQLDEALAEVERLEKENEGLRSDNGELQDRLYSLTSPVEETPKKVLKGFEIRMPEDFDYVKSEDVIPTAKEMFKNRQAAIESMFIYLMDGDAPLKAIEQIERNNKLCKANEYGYMNIPSINTEYEKIIEGYYDLRWKHCSTFTSNLIKEALLSNDRGERIASQQIREQVRKRAMMILEPMADESCVATSINRIEDNLKTTLDNTVEYFRAKNKKSNN